MGWYILKLVLLLPLIGLLVWGSLKLTARMNTRFGMLAPRERSVRIVESSMLAPGLKLAVLEFHGREILVSASRTGLTRLAEAPARAPVSGIPDETASTDEAKIKSGQSKAFGQILHRLMK